MKIPTSLSFRPARVLVLIGFATTLLVIGCDLLGTDEPIDSLSNPLRRVFRGRLTYPAGETPYEVLTGDLNRDGLLDIVSLDWTVETASVLLADGAGDYAAAVAYELGASPRAAVLADLSGNTILDLAVVNETHAQVTLLFGDGTGVFGESTAINLVPESAPRALVASDLNNDDIIDLVTADQATATVTLIIGEGAGVFLEPVSISLGQTPAGLWVGDITDDGIVDIVAANPDNDTLAILEGNGIGYLPVRLLACGYMPQQVTGADLDNDGLVDLVAGNAGSGDLSVLFSMGQGNFAEETRIAMPYPVGRFVVADLGGNTIPDIAAALFDKTSDDKQSISRFAVLRGKGDGSFGVPAIYGSGWFALGITAADMNNSGRLDLLTADYITNTVSIAYNRGNALFESDRRYTVGSNPGPAIAADFSQDGRNDLAVMNYDSNTISLLQSNGDGEFETLTPITLSGKPLAMATGDLNNDNRLDLVVSLSAQAQILVYLATGMGRFAGAQFYPVQTDAARGLPEVLSLALGDMNNDGSLDIVTGNSRVDSASVLLNDGTGVFAAPLVSDVGNYPRNVHLSDTNGDGALDLIFLSSQDPLSPNDAADPRVVRWFGKGDGTFDAETHLRFATSESPTMLAMADITGNGRMDAITVHPGNNSVFVLGGLQNGNFSQASRIYIGYRPIAVTFSDINRDGLADLAATLNAGSVVVRFSRGELKFEDPNNFILSEGMVSSVVADISGDGIMDLVAINAARDDIGILIGQTP